MTLVSYLARVGPVTGPAEVRLRPTLPRTAREDSP
jgi:hypothetical protein